MRQLTADFDARFRCGDTPWEEPHPWHGLEALFARYVPAAARVLDVGCGLGTNALRLAALGYHVLAIDVSATAIAAAKARALAADSSCEFRCADLLSGGLGPAEVAFERGCLHSFADAEGRASFARALAESLVPGGLWLCVCGSADNGDSPERVQTLGLPRLTLAELAGAVEPQFEVLELSRAAYGTTSDTDFLAWVGVFRRREPVAVADHRMPPLTKGT